MDVDEYLMSEQIELVEPLIPLPTFDAVGNSPGDRVLFANLIVE